MGLSWTNLGEKHLLVVNGVKIEEETDSGNGVPLTNPFNSTATIGMAPVEGGIFSTGSASFTKFQGDLASFALYPANLTCEQIIAHYEAGTGDEGDCSDP